MGPTTAVLFDLVVSFISDFLIAFSTAVMSAALATGSAELPSRAVWIVGILSGLLAGARRMQAILQTPPAALRLTRPKPDA